MEGSDWSSGEIGVEEDVGELEEVPKGTQEGDTMTKALMTQ